MKIDQLVHQELIAFARGHPEIVALAEGIDPEDNERGVYIITNNITFSSPLTQEILALQTAMVHLFRSAAIPQLYEYPEQRNTEVNEYCLTPFWSRDLRLLN